MDQQAYELISERSVHVNPSTSPNYHESKGQANVGGHAQLIRTAEFQEALTYITVQAAMLASSILDRRELPSVLRGLLKAETTISPAPPH